MRLIKHITATLASESANNTGLDGIFYNGSDIAPCRSPLYCYGPILRDIQLARPFADSKTYVDMPTRVPLNQVLAGYENLTKPIKNGTELLDFLWTYFAPAGQELISIDHGSLYSNATFLDQVQSAVNREFTDIVIKLWSNMTRMYNESAICAECETSFIPVKRPFVVAGGRFREPYYWDSYWIIHGLLRSAGSFTEIARNQIENFFDLVETYGFMPNGARKYYLNRAGPPLLAQMVRIYLEHTNDLTILDRGLPILEIEHNFFMGNRTINTTIDGKIYTLNSDTSDDEKDWQYSSLASGAESGWDFSSRFMRNPRVAAEDTYFPLASYNTADLLPVDLNSILYWNEVTIADFHNKTGNETESELWRNRARVRSETMYDLMWNDTLSSYFDYNMTSNRQEVLWARDSDALPIETLPATSNDTQVVFNIAQLTPFWTGAAEPSVRDSPQTVRRAFQKINDYLDARPGGIAPTNFGTTQQWDQPNVWPPHMHMLMEALLRTPATHGKDDEDWQWTQDLALRLGQRYFDSAFCTWRATGGSSPSSPLLPNLTRNSNGLMFEKYSDQSLNEAGSGGEYEVVVGFGWSNGVLIWVVDTFRDLLQTAICPNLTDTTSSAEHDVHGDGADAASALELDKFDAGWTSEHAGGEGLDDGEGLEPPPRLQS